MLAFIKVLLNFYEILLLLFIVNVCDLWTFLLKILLKIFSIQFFFRFLIRMVVELSYQALDFIISDLLRLVISGVQLNFDVILFVTCLLILRINYFLINHRRFLLFLFNFKLLDFNHQVFFFLF